MYSPSLCRLPPPKSRLQCRHIPAQNVFVTWNLREGGTELPCETPKSSASQHLIPFTSLSCSHSTSLTHTYMHRPFLFPKRWSARARGHMLTLLSHHEQTTPQKNLWCYVSQPRSEWSLGIHEDTWGAGCNTFRSADGRKQGDKQCDSESFLLVVIQIF